MPPLEPTPRLRLGRLLRLLTRASTPRSRISCCPCRKARVIEALSRGPLLHLPAIRQLMPQERQVWPAAEPASPSLTPEELGSEGSCLITRGPGPSRRSSLRPFDSRSPRSCRRRLLPTELPLRTDSDRPLTGWCERRSPSNGMLHREVSPWRLLLLVRALLLFRGKAPGRCVC